MLRVLIVADDLLMRERLADLLRADPEYDIVGPVDPDDAPGLAREVDLVLWDLGSAGRGSWSGTDLGQDVPVVALGSPGQPGPAMAAGARGYLARDVDAPTLRAALRAAAAGLQVIDPAIIGPASDDEAVPVEDLTPREREVLQHLAEGLSNKAIAQRLRISEHTVKFHVDAILGKLGARTRTEAVTRAARQGLLIL